MNIYSILLKESSALTCDEISFLRKEYMRLGRVEFEKLVRVEKSNVPFASFRLSELGIDKIYWSELYAQYQSRNKQVLEIVTKIFDGFAEAGLKTICVYENFGTVLSADMPIGCFSSGDVDLTVNPSEENMAIDVLAKNGFNLKIRKDHAAVPRKLILPFYNPNVLEGKGYWLNIMRRPVSRNFMLVQFLYNKRLTSIRQNETELYKDTNIRILKPTPMVYYNALHFACEHYYSASPGMSLCCDMDRVIRTRDVNIEELARWAKEDKAGLRLRLALDVCQEFLGTLVPLDIFGNESKYYKKLRNNIIDGPNNALVPQIGKWARFRTELMSDDMPIVWALTLRLWRK